MKIYGWKKESRHKADGEGVRSKKTSRKKLRRKRKPTSKERKAVGIMAPDAKNDKIVAEIKKMPVLTPYAVATKYNIRISIAKDFFKRLEGNGAVQLVSGSHNLKIYKPAAS